MARLATRRGLLLSQTLDALGDDPAAILPDLALLLYEDAVTTASELAAMPNKHRLARAQRIKTLQQSAQPEDRLAVILYQQHQGAK